MKKLVSSLIVSCLAMVTISSGAFAAEYDKVFQEAKTAIQSPPGSPDAVQVIPIQEPLLMIKTSAGPVLMTPGGRLLITDFKAYDTMSGKRLSSVSDVGELSRVDLNKMGIDVDKMATFTYGSGKHTLVVFVDPRCPHCSNLMDQMPALKDSYTFKLVLLPVLGPKSEDAVEGFWCMKDREKATEMLISKNLKALAAEEPVKCDMKAVEESQRAAQKLGVRGVPFTVFPSGSTQQTSQSLKESLENDLRSMKK